MKNISQHIMAIFLVLTIVAYPQITGIGRAVQPESAMAAASMSHHSHGEAGKLEHHGYFDHETGKMQHTAAAISTDIVIQVKASCHPCCVVGVGPCVAVVPKTPLVLERTLIRSFGRPPSNSSGSLLRAPQPHPPELRA